MPKKKEKAPSVSPVKKGSIKAASHPTALPSPAHVRLIQPGFWRKHGLAAGLIMLLAFALYAASISYGYILDDEMVIHKNAYVLKGIKGIRDIFAYDSFMGYFQKKESLLLLEGGRYRPLSLATFALEIEIFGKNRPNISHFINILLYGFTGILLYRLFLAFLPLGERGVWYFSAALVGALVYIAHPLHSEAVANIKGRDEILALLCSLGALYASIKYLDTHSRLWYGMSGVLLLLGMFSKENALTFLAVIPLTLWFFGRASGSQVLRAAVPLLLAAIVFIWVRYRALGFMLDHGQAVKDLMNNPFIEMTRSEKYATIFLTLGWYIKLLFWPHPLTHDYYPYHVPKVNWSDWRPLLSLIFYVGIGLWALFNLKRRRIPAYAIAYWLLTLSIVSNLFVSVGTFMNERFAYMPSVAFALLVGWFLAVKLPQWLGEEPQRPYLLGLGLAALIVGIFSFLTIRRVPVWKDVIALNTAAVRVSPNSARSHCFYVTALYEHKYQKAKNPTEKARWVDTMEYHINRSLAINPNYGSALVMKGAVAAARYEQNKQLDTLLSTFQMLMERIPNNANFRPFFNEYIKYLANASGKPQQINEFVYRLGYDYFFRQKKDLPNAVAVMELLLNTLAEDERLVRAIAEVYAAGGNPQKAAEMQQRAASRMGLKAGR
ncbi:MAG: hypothetical protein NZM43_08530 [Saprospiraceae bacterium]|nr:hypothetical protein [Saprospiraceae bacterium]MDW8484356.1 hypothetical protein [Saprospiraceae bacterium]